MPNLKIHRKKNFHGLLVPFYAVVDCELPFFLELAERLRIAAQDQNAEEMERCRQELDRIEMLPIWSGKEVSIRKEGRPFRVFVTNANYENTEIYPLLCSNELVIDRDTQAVFAAEKQWGKNIRYVLRQDESMM